MQSLSYQRTVGEQFFPKLLVYICVVAEKRPKSPNVHFLKIIKRFECLCSDVLSSLSHYAQRHCLAFTFHTFNNENCIMVLSHFGYFLAKLCFCNNTGLLSTLTGVSPCLYPLHISDWSPVVWL